MSELARVLLRPGNDLAIEATLTAPVLMTCQTAYLQVASLGAPRTEFGIRVERGRVVDVYLWDGFSRTRHALSPFSVDLKDDAIVSRVPWQLVSPLHEYPDLRASFVVNGGLLQSGVPVRIEGLFSSVAAIVRTARAV